MPGNNPVIAFLNKMTDLLILNALFVLCSVPIVTIGPAITAMYCVNLRSIRYGDGYVVQIFFRSLRRDFWQALVAWLVTMAVGSLFALDIFFWLQSDLGAISVVMTVVSIFFAFLAFIIVIWLFPLIAKTENKLSVHVKNAAAMAVGHFIPYTLICAAILFGVFYAAYVSLAADIILFLIGFAVVSYMLSFFIYRVFAMHMQEEPLDDDDPLYGEQKKGY